MPCFYGNGDDIDANDGGDGNLRLAQVVEVMHYKDTDGADIDADDGGSSNLGLAQVVGVRSWQDGDGHCDGTEVVEETKNKPDPDMKKKHNAWMTL